MFKSKNFRNPALTLKPVGARGIFKRDIIWAIGFLLALSACTDSFLRETKNDPKGRLTEYISKSFSVKSPNDKNELVKYLTGDAKARLSGWSEDQFREAFIDSKRNFIKLQIREIKPVSPTETNLTYEISYFEESKGKDGKMYNTKITNKKLCRMFKEDNHWLIGEVRNIKELVEFKDELTLP